MKLGARVCIMAVCVFSAQAVPYLVDKLSAEPVVKDSISEILVAQLRTAIIDPRALSPAGAACANYFNNSTQRIASKLANATSTCEDNANHTVVNNQRDANVTINSMRQNQLVLERNLQSCRNYTSNEAYVNCTTSLFDSNLSLLDLNNALAYTVNSQAVANSTVVQIQLQNCVSAAVSKTKVELIEATNDYNQCIRMAQNQREVSVPNRKSKLIMV